MNFDPQYSMPSYKATELLPLLSTSLPENKNRRLLSRQILQLVLMASLAANLFLFLQAVQTWRRPSSDEMVRDAFSALSPEAMEQNRKRHSIGGSLGHCDPQLLRPSTRSPRHVHKVRPADIHFVAALGDSITTAYHGDNGEVQRGLQYQDTADPNFVGNSFAIGGNEELNTRISLPNILRQLNPAVAGFSIGRGLDKKTSHLNVARPGKRSTDLPRQAADLVQRIAEKYPDYEQRWKLVSIYIGTNDFKEYCIGGNSTSSDAFKTNLERSLRLLRDGLPRMIDVWHVNVTFFATTIFYGESVGCPLIASQTMQSYVDGYRKVIREIEMAPEFQTPLFSVVVQRIFEQLREPIRKNNGDYFIEFYATDIFHISKFGNSLIAKLLWRSLLSPVGSRGKSAEPAEFHYLSPHLECPSRDCPFIRTLGNSLSCSRPDE